MSAPGSGGMSALGGVCSGRVSAWGCLLWGGCLLQGVSALGGVYSGVSACGVSALGGVYFGGCLLGGGIPACSAEADTPLL